VPGARRKPRRVEDDLQSKIIAEVEPILGADFRIYAIPNGGFRLFSEAVRLNRTGVRKGITDTVVIGPGGFTAWLEVKTKERGSRLDDEQEGFKNYCLRCGQRWGLARSAEEAISQLRSWGCLKPGR
jgi:hypothetical protein